MRITQVTVWQVDLSMTKTYYLSGGRLKFELLDSTLVRINSDAGRLTSCSPTMHPNRG